jgi:tripartite-type tricarboxylate transporter receptor subunit TctC
MPFDARLLSGLSCVCGLLTQVAFAASLYAQDFPTRPIRLIVPWPPGGGTDTTARNMGPKMAELLGQPLVIDNRPGASGLIGTELSARAPADGYTILFAAAGPNAILPVLMPKAPYEALKDFSEVSLFAYTLYVMVVHASSPANSIKELVALAKAKPGQVTMGTSGRGTPAYISGAMLKRAAGIDVNPVFYKGAAGPVVEVLGRHITLAIVTIPTIMSHVRAGRLKALAVTAAKRSTQMPGVPTVAESGYPGFEVINWYGILAPAGVPRNVVTRLNEVVDQTAKTPEVRKSLVTSGLEVLDSKTPEEYAAFRKADLAKWKRVVKEIDLKLE